MSAVRGGRSGQIVCAVVRRGADVLMVRERMLPPDEAWVLPGGLVEPGELVHDAVVREVQEETGLAVCRPVGLAYVCQFSVEEPAWPGMWTVFAFETEIVPQGLAATDHALDPDDPDGLVLEAAWVPGDEAVARLARSTFRPRRDPAVRHLRDGGAGAALWLWPDGVEGEPLVLPTRPMGV
ncbi:NUDIX hydrolase [Actinomadura atramentaria]|uniref:NUDIX hydrolase n=1 Tax=Actinomadura atramentaria TaxID=1990 RepID=UPI0003609482|nr:NUDIX hydrolase [Actinomadura atramentaria]